MAKTIADLISNIGLYISADVTSNPQFTSCQSPSVSWMVEGQEKGKAVFLPLTELGHHGSLVKWDSVKKVSMAGADGGRCE